MRRLDAVGQPTLLIHGARDLLVPLSAARRMGAAHPGWRFEIAPDTGHVPMLEAPQWTTAVIEDWMAAEGEPAVGASAAPYGDRSADPDQPFRGDQFHPVRGDQLTAVPSLPSRGPGA